MNCKGCLSCDTSVNSKEDVVMTNKDVYLIYGNYSTNPYGQQLKCFGIYTDKEKAEKEANRIKDNMIEAAMKAVKENTKPDSYIEPELIWVTVVPVCMDMAADIYMGGYTENEL